MRDATAALVEELRSCGTRVGMNLIHRAADEIERLNKENERLRTSR